LSFSWTRSAPEVRFFKQEIKVLEAEIMMARLAGEPGSMSWKAKVLTCLRSGCYLPHPLGLPGPAVEFLDECDRRRCERERRSLGEPLWHGLRLRSLAGRVLSRAMASLGWEGRFSIEWHEFIISYLVPSRPRHVLILDPASLLMAHVATRGGILDLDGQRLIAMDFLGRGPLFYSVMAFDGERFHHIEIDKADGEAALAWADRRGLGVER